MDARQAAFRAEKAHKIELALDRARRAERYVVNTVREAHDSGLSWTEIGELLGISRQAARQKYRATETD